MSFEENNKFYVDAHYDFVDAAWYSSIGFIVVAFFATEREF